MAVTGGNRGPSVVSTTNLSVKSSPKARWLQMDRERLGVSAGIRQNGGKKRHGLAQP
jgi:hypothetical protein